MTTSWAAPADGKSVTRMRHVQVGEKYVKVFCNDTAERFAHACYRDHVEAIAF
jgi:hypothetical protein